MNIILAQLKKDILCQRWLLIFWGICVALPLVAIITLGGFSHLSHYSKFEFSTDKPAMAALLSVGMLFFGSVSALGLAIFILIPVLVINIVQEDLLMGTTAFWLTRPIPHEKLLAAKALLIAGITLPLILLSIFCTPPNGNHPWFDALAWISAFAAVASITPSGNKFIAYAIALVIGKGIFSGCVEYIWNRFHGSGSIFPLEMLQTFTAMGRTLHINGFDLFHIYYFIGFSAVFAHQYLTLQTKRSLVLLIAVIAVISLLRVLVGPLGYSSAM